MDVEHTKWWNWQGDEGEFRHPNLVLSAWSTNSSNSTNGTDERAAEQEMYKARIDNYMEILAAVSGSVVTVVTWSTFSPRCYISIFLSHESRNRGSLLSRCYLCCLTHLLSIETIATSSAIFSCWKNRVPSRWWSFHFFLAGGDLLSDFSMILRPGVPIDSFCCLTPIILMLVGSTT